MIIWNIIMIDDWLAVDRTSVDHMIDDRKINNGEGKTKSTWWTTYWQDCYVGVRIDIGVLGGTICIRMERRGEDYYGVQ